MNLLDHLMGFAYVSVALLIASTAAGVSILEYADKFNASTTISASPSTGEPSSSSAPHAGDAEAAEPPVDKTEEQDCSDQIGTIQNGVPVNTMRKYDVEEILKDHGGAPGKVNATWNKDVREFPVSDVKESPLPDTDNTTFWLYDFRLSDFKTFVRLEHALLRQKGEKDEYIDVRGELYWTPPDFCNKSRHATYRLDPHSGFVSTVSLEYCDISSESLWCAWPASCQSNETYYACVAAPSSALIASLVG